MTAAGERVTKKTKRAAEEKKSRARSHFRAPRKQFVRRQGWLRQALLRKTKIEESGRQDPLKYFTLCGAEALDVLYLASQGVLDFDGRGYPGVVFCEADSDCLADIISRLGRTLHYFPDRLENVVLDVQNPFNAEFERLIAFDIFNLDFSGVCFPRRDAPYSQTLQVLTKIISLQGVVEADFDLFVTFRAERSRENATALQELKRNMKENFGRHTGIRDSFSGRHGDIDRLLKRDYPRFLLATFPKLILRYGNDKNYRVAWDDGYMYKSSYRDRNTGHQRWYHIVKFLFTFDFEPASSGILQTGPIRSETLAESYVDAVTHAILLEVTDVDCRLRGDAGLKRELKLEVEQLLHATTPDSAAGSQASDSPNLA